MSLRGNLRTMELPEILEWISRSRKQGTLHVQRRSVQKKLGFRGGLIVSSTSNHPREYLGQYLVRYRFISEEQLFKALLRQEAEGRPLGRLLVEDGTLTEADLKGVLEAKAHETLYDLFLWPEGDFEFRENDLPDEIFVPLALDVTAVTLEGMRRIDEWERIRAVIPSARTSFRSLGPSGQDPTEEQVLRLVGLGRTLEEIALDLHASEFDAAYVLFRMNARGLVEVAAGPAEAPAADQVAAIREGLARAESLLRQRRYGPALEAYEDVLAHDRLNQPAKKGLIAVTEAKSRDRAVRQVPLDEVPVLRMDLLSLTRQNFDPQEGFVLSRINGQWDVRSILKLCPMAEEEALLIFARLLERNVIELLRPEAGRS
jgi:hypothetical protein